MAKIADERMIGNLEAGLKGLSDQLNRLEKNTRDDFRNVFAKLEQIQSDGCAKGKLNENRLNEYDKKPERWIAAIAMISAVISAIAAFFGWNN